MSILIATLGFTAALAFALLVIASTTLAYAPRIRTILAIEFGDVRNSASRRARPTLHPARAAVTLRPAPLQQAGPLRAAA